jgi:hypothetical protein
METFRFKGNNFEGTMPEAWFKCLRNSSQIVDDCDQILPPTVPDAHVLMDGGNWRTF